MRRMVGSAVVGNVGLSVEVSGRMRKVVGKWGCSVGWVGQKNKMNKMVG